MIAFLRGLLAGKTVDAAYIDVQGVGYEASMSYNSLSKLPEIGEEVAIRTYLHVSDNGVSLYGFITDEEKSLFEKLIGVSGVGPKMALAALSTFTPSDLAEAIAAQDTALVSKIPGVGKKTASRIILELKGSLDKLPGSLFEGEAAGSGGNAVREGALEALLSMGFTQTESELALKDAPEGSSEEGLLKYALRRLGSNA